jgi:hypothetical protein
MASFINSKMVATGKTYPKTYHLTQPFIGTCPQWREAGVIEQLMTVLHGQVREQVKKAESLGCGSASPKPFQEKS